MAGVNRKGSHRVFISAALRRLGQRYAKETGIPPMGPADPETGLYRPRDFYSYDEQKGKPVLSDEEAAAAQRDLERRAAIAEENERRPATAE